MSVTDVRLNSAGLPVVTWVVDPVHFSASFAVKHPYDISFGDGEYTAFVGPFTGTFTGPLELPDGSVIEPTGKSFEVVFSTIARWRDGRIVEEYLKYDNAAFLQQIGLA